MIKVKIKSKILHGFKSVILSAVKVGIYVGIRAVSNISYYFLCIFIYMWFHDCEHKMTWSFKERAAICQIWLIVLLG